MLIKIRRDMQEVMLNQLSNVKEKVHNLQKESLDRLQSQALKEQQLQGHIALMRGENEQLKQQILHIERDKLTLRDCVKTCEKLSKSNQNLVI
jgi:DNA repair exonuclease SbcCD ATPase subunit